VGKRTPKKQAAAGGRTRRSRTAGLSVAQSASGAPTPVPEAAATANVTVTPTDSAPAAAATNVAPYASAASGALVLGASLSIRDVGECAAQFKALFAAGSAEVDARMLESVDTAGLQLLLAAAAAARRRGLTLKLLGAERLNAGPANALGLTDHLAAAAEIQP
jgi:anti-anti-sigma regulatory factor